MRQLLVRSMVLFLATVGLVTCVTAQAPNPCDETGVTCWGAGSSSCSAWYACNDPYGPNPISTDYIDCTVAAGCGCSNQGVPASTQNPSYCGCAGVMTLRISQTIAWAFPCTPGQHNNCKDNWTLKTKYNNLGQLVSDGVQCGTVRSCPEDCHAEPHMVNGQIVYGPNVCYPPNSVRAVYSSQRELAGNPC